MDKSKHTVERAKALRLAAGDSLITLASRLSVQPSELLRMERGDGDLRTAQRVVGYYWGRTWGPRNERERKTEIGRRIRELRHAAGVTATELAAQIGVKPHLIWAIERAPHMSRKTCRKIAAHYCVPVSELVEAA